MAFHKSTLIVGPLAVLSACLFWAAPLAATGPYLFGSFGAREVSNQDMNDFFAQGSQQTNAPYIASSVGEAYLTVGYRFTDPFALEVAGGAQQGREESNLYSFGNVDLQVPSGDLTLFSIAPVFCFDTFESPESSWLNQVGFRLEYAQVAGVETLESGDGGISSLNFNGAAVGGGLFYRLVNLWAPARLSVGLEAGYDILKFTNLVSGDPNGVFVGQSSRTLDNLNGGAAFLDNSGPYLRLVVGWVKDSSMEKARVDEEPSPAVLDSAQRLLKQARAALDRGDKAAALNAYRAYLKARPRDAGAWRDLAQVYEAYGRPVYARQCLDAARALEQGPLP